MMIAAARKVVAEAAAEIVPIWVDTYTMKVAGADGLSRKPEEVIWGVGNKEGTRVFKPSKQTFDEFTKFVLQVQQTTQSIACSGPTDRAFTTKTGTTNTRA